MQQEEDSMDAEDYITKHWNVHRVWRVLENPKHQERFNQLAARLTPNRIEGGAPPVFYDVGCATGHSTVELAKRVPGKWVGIDFSKTAIEGAKKNFPALQFEYLKTPADLCQLPPADGIVCSEVIEHVEADAVLVRALLQSTCPGGVVVISTPNKKVNDPGHLRVYTEKSIRVLFPRENPAQIDTVPPFFYISWSSPQQVVMSSSTSLTLAPGEKVRVALEHPIFDAIKEYIKHLTRTPAHTQRFDSAVLKTQCGSVHRPVYFCTDCGKIEDGTHRVGAALIAGDKDIEVIAGAGCDKRFAAHSPLWAAHAVSKLDLAWVHACENQKWAYIEAMLNLKGTTILDLGSQTGYSAIRSELLGAQSIDAVEIRPEAMESAKTVAAILGLSRITWHCHDVRTWLKKGPVTQETIFCMGLLHYFSPEDIQWMLTPDFLLAGKQVALEFRSHSHGNECLVFGTQTILPLAWVKNLLNKNQFAITSCWTDSKPSIRFDRTMLTARRS